MTSLYRSRPLRRPGSSPEEVAARLHDLLAAGLGRGGVGLGLAFEVGEVGLAERAGDDVDVEPEVVGQVGVEDVEEQAPELLAGRAGQPVPPPDRPQAVQAGFAPVLADLFEPGPEFGRVAEGLLDPRQGPGGEFVGQVGPEGGEVEVARGVRSGSWLIGASDLNLRRVVRVPAPSVGPSP